MPSVGKKRREQESARKRAASEAENEIYPIPPITDFKRRVECQRNPALWLRTYLPHVFYSDFSQSQLDFIKTCWSAIKANGSKNVNAYRGFGKSSILSGLMLMMLTTGKIRHAYYIVAEGGRAAKQRFNWFNSALYESFDVATKDAKPFVADYPEICYPIQRRRGVANKPLTYRGAPCKIVLSPERIQFPVIAGSPSSGSALVFASIGSAIRGAEHTIDGCGSFRVGAVMFDDVQTDESAKSEAETDSIVSSMISSASYLSGVDKEGRQEPLIILSAITQNRPGDAAERIRNEMPQLGTEIIPFLRSTPTDFSAWRKYREIYREIYRENATDAITARNRVNDYYLANRTELERDCIADDPRRYESTQVSAIQSALEKWCVSERSFWCELQNDADRGAQEEDGGLSPIVVFRKKRPAKPDASRRLKRWEIPDGTDVLTAFIDAGEHYLNYEVVAFAADGRFSHVVDFGVWPEQNFPTTSKKNFRRDLQEVYRRGDRFDRLRDATLDCLRAIFERQYFDAEGAPVDLDLPSQFLQHARTASGSRRVFRKLALCGVDCSDGEMTSALWDAIAAFHRVEDGRFYGRAIPCYGDSAKTRLLRFYDLKPGEWRRGGNGSASTCDWIENPASRRSELDAFSTVPAALMYDSNTYKSRRDDAWKAPLDRDGATSIFEWDEAEYLQMFASQQCAEEPSKETRLSGQLYKIWTMKKPRVADNEFLDTDAGARALAHYVGVEPSIGRAAPIRIRWIDGL